MFYTRFQICAEEEKEKHVLQVLDRETGCFIQSSFGKVEFVVWVKTDFSIHRSNYMNVEAEDELLDVYQWLFHYLSRHYKVNFEVRNCKSKNRNSVPEEEAKTIKSRNSYFLTYIRS